jgi:hypothetical protein
MPPAKRKIVQPAMSRFPPASLSSTVNVHTRNSFLWQTVQCAAALTCNVDLLATRYFTTAGDPEKGPLIRDSTMKECDRDPPLDSFHILQCKIRSVVYTCMHETFHCGLLTENGNFPIKNGFSFFI